jgi:hypothetical protein
MASGTGGTFSFDSAEFEEPAEDSVTEALEELEEQPSEDDPELFDVDLKLEIAAYYRAILKHEFFDTSEDSPKSAKIVDGEIRAFIKERLEHLLGVRIAPTRQEVRLPFSEDEIGALKLLAAKVMKKPTLVTESPVKRMETPVLSKPVIKPKAQPLQATRRPTVTAPVQPPKPKQKTASRPAQAPQKAPSAPVQEKPASPAPGVTQTYINAVGKEVTLVEGEIIEEDGHKFQVVRNDAGTLYKKDVSGQVINPNRLQPMSVQQISLASEQMARQQLETVDDLTGRGIVHMLSQ